MKWLDFGQDVEVIYPGTSTRDALGHRVESPETRETVHNVIIAPPDTAVLTQLNADATATLHFPKGFTKSLCGASVEFGGARYAVIGDPLPYNEDATPGDWYLPVHVGHSRKDGDAYVS